VAVLMLSTNHHLAFVPESRNLRRLFWGVLVDMRGQYPGFGSICIRQSSSNKAILKAQGVHGAKMS
jgi:hypothetical protein